MNKEKLKKSCYNSGSKCKKNEITSEKILKKFLLKINSIKTRKNYKRKLKKRRSIELLNKHQKDIIEIIMEIKKMNDIHPKKLKNLRWFHISGGTISKDDLNKEGNGGWWKKRWRWKEMERVEMG